MKPHFVLALPILILVAGSTQATSLDICHPYCGHSIAWKAKDISCLDLNRSLWEQARDIPSAFREEIFPPQRISGSRISTEWFEGIETPPFVSQMLLLINRDGQIEMIYAPEFGFQGDFEDDGEIKPEIEKRLLTEYRKWAFEPATLDGIPICVWYSVRLHLDVTAATNAPRIHVYPKAANE